MKIIVANTMAPFVWGGAEELTHNLIINLRAVGYDASLYRLPFAWDPFDQIPTEMARMKALSLPKADLVISMKFPVYLLNVENHMTWLIHQYRQAYDLWDSPYCNIPHDRFGQAIREMIIAHDTAALGARKRLFTISEEISSRLVKSIGIRADPLRTPLNDPDLFTGGSFENYVLAPGRINATKRQSLLVQAMLHADQGTRLIIAGSPETEADGNILRELVERHGLENRVTLDLGFLKREKIAEYVNNARAIAYLPFQEDSYGYVTMEAFEAGKPVITVTDAGELLEIVVDQKTGSVVEPEVRQLGRAMSNYCSNEKVARDHGASGRAMWRSKNINWPETISQLVGF